MEKLLNWDHEVIPTSLEDVLLNLVEESTKFTGRETRVRVENKRLLVIEQYIPEKVETKFYDGYPGVVLVEEIKSGGYWNTAVVLNLYNHGREVLGHLNNVVGGVNRVSLSTFVDKAVNKSYHENK